MKHRLNRLLFVLTLIGLVGLTAACGPSPEEVEAAAQQEAWAALEAAKQALDGKRAELAELQAQLEAASAVTEEGAEGEGEAVDLEALGQQITAMQADVDSTAEAFGNQLVDFINNAGIVEGEPLTETQLAAIRLKSSEDMLVAADFINKGGDYKRAIDIFKNAMTVDPDNAELQAALATAEDMRFISEERFATVKKGMTEDKVRAALGQVNLRNVRDYASEGRDVVAWFYPREDGGAAAVWYRMNKGQLKVYQVNYDEVKPPQAE